MKILIVDDDRTNRAVINGMLRKDNHAVVTAENGLEAISVFQQEQPDLVLMDIMMPVMNGYDSARRIKEQHKGRFTPIIFVTAMTDDRALAKCVDCGGDDFLTKPVNRVILRAKIDAMKRIQSLYRTVVEQKERIERDRDKTEEEIRLARHIFDAATVRRSWDSPSLRSCSMSVGQFSGDLLAYDRSPSGNLNVLLGDFTGHGLPSAIGALPTADVFYSMTVKGFGISRIAAEINKKLNLYLPTGRFCAAALIGIDLRKGSVQIWNGGLPPILVVDSDGKITKRVPSTKLPLGVADPEEFDHTVETLLLAETHSILLYSDGLIEAQNRDGNMFGCAGLDRAIAMGDGNAMLDSISSEVIEFTNGRKLEDDLSLVEIASGALQDEEPAINGTAHSAVDALSSQWSFELQIGGDKLKDVDPIPVIMDWMEQMRLPKERQRILYVVLGELVNNAIDHGLLGLDSSLKKSPEGFERYYSVRSEGLQHLNSGFVKIGIGHLPGKNGNGIRLRVEDSGPGFDIKKVVSGLEGNEQHFGRGIALVRSLCARLDYLGSGNTVEAEYLT